MKKLSSSLLLAISVLFGNVALADVATGTDANDVILAGYDTVAYHTEGRPVKGEADITALYNGAIYRFASKKNRDLFTANPASYAPAYGGFCAYGAALGKKFLVDGKAFEVVDGQLYVNKNLSVYKVWKKDVAGNISKADRQWPNIKDVAADDL